MLKRKVYWSGEKGRGEKEVGIKRKKVEGDEEDWGQRERMTMVRTGKNEKRKKNFKDEEE